MSSLPVGIKTAIFEQVSLKTLQNRIAAAMNNADKCKQLFWVSAPDILVGEWPLAEPPADTGTVPDPEPDAKEKSAKSHSGKH